MPVKHRLDAIDRSIERVRITTIWPSARMIRIEVSLKTWREIAAAGKGREARRDQPDQHDDGRGQPDLAVFEESLHAAIPAAVADQRFGVEPLVVVDRDDAALRA